MIILTAPERAALDQLGERERTVRKGVTLVRENERSTELFALRSGMLIAYVLLDDGSRQILRFIFPGDLTGMAVIAFGKAPHALLALADSVVVPIDRTQLAELVLRHPRVALALAALEQVERTTLTDRLAGLGRLSARARVAAVLLDLRDRIRRQDDSTGDTFQLGLTQEEIGDATGLTAVHVNRMLRQLEDQGLIARSGGRVTLLDEARLMRSANHVDRLAAVDLSWLPGPSAG
ncbi:Crp/Fnr family transcriptional regulator [Sphingomonas sp. RHCKR7]|uniref:Crp/Fnr family transcriptional regulator n=1 Tax=Sphingomonas folli TaxID=2862497 RepID=UPI001C665215|nr:Crp/Fnr family transcriptional regulator [Sphingomonas folli]MBW6527776.1 Crp/Fnr family transcriptional regulator [Sphingomonas folli]